MSGLATRRSGRRPASYPRGVQGSRAEVTNVPQVGVHPLTFALELREVGRGWQLVVPPLRVIPPSEYHDLKLTSITPHFPVPHPTQCALLTASALTDYPDARYCGI